MMYDICKANDGLYDGDFFMGVLTTRIYCIASCKARLPLYKNVEFFQTKEEAVENGMRGCLRCKNAWHGWLAGTF